MAPSRELIRTRCTDGWLVVTETAIRIERKGFLGAGAKTTVLPRAALVAADSVWSCQPEERNHPILTGVRCDSRRSLVCVGACIANGARSCGSQFLLLSPPNEPVCATQDAAGVFIY